MRNTFEFQLEATHGLARAGVLSTPHGPIKTPVFMPVGTRGSVKSVSPQDLEELGAQIILGNTYHLYLRPGEALVEKMGGLHRFMNWSHPILTDSGGYQVSSLGLFRPDRSQDLAKIDDEGVTFTSHLDGSKHRFTPEKAIEIQAAIGADIIMAFDEATPVNDKAYARKSMERTHAWLVRCIKKWRELEAEKKGRVGERQPEQALFGIIQGGDFEDLRRESAEFVVRQDLPGIAIGGATIGQSREETERNVAFVRDLLPAHKPRYAMGVGVDPNHAIGAVLSGVDMFDCVAPTRLARTGLLYTGNLEIPAGDVSKARFVSESPKLRLSIDNAEFATDDRVIDEQCDCYTCRQGFSRAYLRHLYKSKELLYYRLASLHNVRMMIRTVQLLRQAIITAR